MNCCFGDHPVDISDPKTFFEQTVWVSGPKKDGAVLRSATGRVACNDCIAAIRAGQEPGAPDLFALVEVPKPVDVTHPHYAEGWVNGFRGQDIHNLEHGREYEAGFEAGEQLRDHLDGYFFFQETP